jgi:hypothetical protein
MLFMEEFVMEVLKVIAIIIGGLMVGRELGDGIGAHFTYKGAFSKAFMGYQSKSTAAQMRSSDLWRLKDGKPIEHWDEFNPLEVSQQIAAATVRQVEEQ